MKEEKKERGNKKNWRRAHAFCLYVFCALSTRLVVIREIKLRVADVDQS